MVPHGDIGVVGGGGRGVNSGIWDVFGLAVNWMCYDKYLYSDHLPITLFLLSIRTGVYTVLCRMGHPITFTIYTRYYVECIMQHMKAIPEIQDTLCGSG